MLSLKVRSGIDGIYPPGLLHQLMEEEDTEEDALGLSGLESYEAVFRVFETNRSAGRSEPLQVTV